MYLVRQILSFYFQFCWKNFNFRYTSHVLFFSPDFYNNDPRTTATITKQLWNIANTLRGTMGADEFRDYILGFIFFKYLSEKSVNFANELLDGEDLSF